MGSNFDIFFVVDEGWEDPNTTLSGPSSTRQRNAIEMAFRWRADDGPTLNAGLVASRFFRGSGPKLLRTLYFCNFPGGGGPPAPPPPPLDPHMYEPSQKKLCRVTLKTAWSSTHDNWTLEQLNTSNEINTVNLEIFARFLFSRNFAYFSLK